MESSRLIYFGVWGVGVVITFSIVVFARWRIWRHHRDRRSFRDLLEGVALWIVAAAAAFAVASVLWFPDVSSLRGALNALALGAFFGAGIVMASDALEQYQRMK